MMVPLDVRFQHMRRNEKIVWAIDGHVAKLDKMYDSIIGCHPVINGPKVDAADPGIHSLYDVQILLVLPCREISINAARHSHADVFTAVDNAFAELNDTLADWLAERHRVKSQTRSTAEL